MKNKVLSLHAKKKNTHAQTQGEAEARLHWFLTSTLDGGSQLYTRAALRPERTTVTTGQEAGTAPEPVWTFRREIPCSCGIRAMDRSSR